MPLSRIVKHSANESLTLPLFTSSSLSCELIPPREARPVIVANHYTHSFPSGQTRTYRIEDALVVFAHSANPYLEPFMFTEPVGLLELARLYAPDGHRKNLLTYAISVALRKLRKDVPECEAVVSFADPLRGHHGGIYQACSWIYVGRSINPLAYRAPDGSIMARRSFHDSSGSYRPENFEKVRVPAKHRYCKLLTMRSKYLLKLKPESYPTSSIVEVVRVIS